MACWENDLFDFGKTASWMVRWSNGCMAGWMDGCLDG